VVEALFTLSSENTAVQPGGTMGRPPLYHTKLHVSIDPKDLARIEALVGEKGRSKFVREAVSKLLEVREHEQQTYKKAQ
jgi:hypothetical protein